MTARCPLITAHCKRMAHQLDPFFTPRSVAVVGASSRPGKLGYSVLENLVRGGYAEKGRVYPINPKASEILGLPAYPSVLRVPDPIDLAVIVIPYPLVPPALRECGQKGIPAAIVISAGFREAGREGLEREIELMQIAREYHIRLIGPNCLGVIDTFTPLNASFAAGTPPSGPMAFMSQSGALGTAILDWALAGRLGLSKFVSLGNKADVNEVDLLRAWADDAATRVILIYTEGLPDGQAFIRTAREVSRKKPIVALKSGVTSAGSRAVSSHTGALAGSEQAYAAALKMFRAREHGQAVLDFLDFLARHPKHPLAPAAQYWIGEAYFVQRDYRQAVVEFEKVLEHGLENPKVPDALLRTGMAWQRLRDTRRAVDLWTRVQREYPKSDAARKAESLLASVRPAATTR